MTESQLPRNFMAQPREGLEVESRSDRDTGAQLRLETAGIHFLTWETELLLWTTAWGSCVFIVGCPAPAGRDSEFKAGSYAGLWDGANLLSCFNALMCKLIIRHCALIKPKWCNGFAVIEARAPPGLEEGGAASAASNPTPGEQRARKCQAWVWKEPETLSRSRGLERMRQTSNQVGSVGLWFPECYHSGHEHLDITTLGQVITTGWSVVTCLSGQLVWHYQNITQFHKVNGWFPPPHPNQMTKMGREGSLSKYRKYWSSQLFSFSFCRYLHFYLEELCSRLMKGTVSPPYEREWEEGGRWCRWCCDMWPR